MLEHKTEEEVISRFIINPVLDQDGGQITCEAANRYGRDQKHFLLSIEGNKRILLYIRILLKHLLN